MGSRSRTRICNAPAPSGGKPCPGYTKKELNNEKKIEYSEVQEIKCRTIYCPVDGGWGKW